MTSQPVSVFVRVDDVTDLTPGLRAVVAMLLRMGIAANYAVIPKRLTPAAADYLREHRHRHPGLMELNQHGFCHEQVIRGQHRWSEFAGHRPYSEQLAAIANGRSILVRSLQDDFGGSVFVPPSHKYDENTLEAVEACGFTILSAACYSSPWARIYYAYGARLRTINLLRHRVSYHCRAIPRHHLLEVSVAIDVDMEQRWHGTYRTKTASRLTDEFERGRRCQPAVGIMLHHEMYSDATKLRTLNTFLQNLRGDPSIAFKTIEAISDDLRIPPTAIAKER
jgi:hypothetical protein